MNKCLIAFYFSVMSCDYTYEGIEPCKETFYLPSALVSSKLTTILSCHLKKNGRDCCKLILFYFKTLSFFRFFPKNKKNQLSHRKNVVDRCFISLADSFYDLDHIF